MIRTMDSSSERYSNDRKAVQDVQKKNSGLLYNPNPEESVRKYLNSI